MKSQVKADKLKYLLKAVMKSLFAAFALLFISANVSAQVNEVLIVKQKAKTTIRPKAKPAPKAVDVSKKVSVRRVRKKNRVVSIKPSAEAKRTSKAAASKNVPAKPSEKTENVPLLAVQLRLLMVSKDGGDVEVNPQAPFTPEDRLRLSLKANQRGYLYIIRQSSPEAEGEIIFPTPIVNGGSNLVTANYEYVIPGNCPKDVIPNPRDCALQLFPFGESPQEFFTVIFTRDKLVDLPSETKNERVSLTNLAPAGKLQTKMLIDLIEDSGQDLVMQKGDTPFSVRIVNVNPNDNEEIIETFVLKKVGKGM